MKRKNIAIIEDSEMLQGKISKIVHSFTDLKIHHYKLNEFRSSTKVDRSNPQLIIIGTDEARNSCLEHLSKMKNAHPKMRAVILTNKPYPLNKIKWTEAGADYYLDKSTEFGVIEDACKTMSFN